MKPRLFVIFAPSTTDVEGGRGRIQQIAENVRKENRDYDVAVTFFDPGGEKSLFGIRVLTSRLRQMRKGHFNVMVVGGSVLNRSIVSIFKKAPPGMRVTNYATPGSALDREVQKVFHVPNHYMQQEAQAVA